MKPKKKAASPVPSETAVCEKDKYDKDEASDYANSREVSSGFVKKHVKRPTKREQVMALYWQAVESLSPGASLSDCKRDLSFALHARWSLWRKIEFFQSVIDDARKRGARS